LPQDEADVVALPFAANGEAELTRDLIQSGHERLRIGGRMFAATNNPTDTWLGDQLGKAFGKVERRSFSAGILYVGNKTERLKKLKNFACEFAFRDHGRLIHVASRPGVFSHRRLDTGARRLIDALQVGPGARVLDIGCGAGAVALAAACCGDGVTVHAVDSNVRATECTQRGALLNGLNNVTTELNASGEYAGAGQFDLALANPPYYSGFQIAEHFLRAGYDALCVGGKLIVVTKFPAWYKENMPRWYDDVLIEELKNYHLIQGIRRGGAEAEMQRL
jgi:16S rRNA (guanine1207-N2)-methyltransferase